MSEQGTKGSRNDAREMHRENAGRREGRGRRLMAEGVGDVDEAVLEAGGGFRAEGFAEGVVFALKQPDRIDRPIKVFFSDICKFLGDFF